LPQCVRTNSSLKVTWQALAIIRRSCAA
jgi:hypothetical protein